MTTKPDDIEVIYAEEPEDTFILDIPLENWKPSETERRYIKFIKTILDAEKDEE